MTAWQKALMMTVLAESPCIDLFDRQKPMSFLNARKSNTECSKDTTNVRNSRYGFPSRNTRFASSTSCKQHHDVRTCYVHCTAIRCTGLCIRCTWLHLLQSQRCPPRQ